MTVTSDEPAPDQLADDEDERDGSGVDYAADPVADEELTLAVLSPEGNAERVREYAHLFGSG